MMNQTKPARVFLSQSQYDTVKVVAQYILPGLAALYIALADLWSLPKALEVAGTVAAVDTFLGVLLGISKSQFNKSDYKYDGTIVVTKNPDDATADLNVSLNPDALRDKDEVVVKVDKTL